MRYVLKQVSDEEDDYVIEEEEDEVEQETEGFDGNVQA